MQPHKLFQLILIQFSFFSFLQIAAAQSSNCSAAAITEAAMAATKTDLGENGTLWGTPICIDATAAHGYKCFNGCARVVSVILKRAGCGNSVTSDAGAIWKFLFNKFEISSSQKAGCILGLNSRTSGNRERLNKPGTQGPSVGFRHVAISVGTSGYVDNYSRTQKAVIEYNGFFSSSRYIDYIIYEKPVYLCPK